jgi:hypothetical protein
MSSRVSVFANACTAGTTSATLHGLLDIEFHNPINNTQSYAACQITKIKRDYDFQKAAISYEAGISFMDAVGCGDDWSFTRVECLRFLRRNCRRSMYK